MSLTQRCLAIVAASITLALLVVAQNITGSILGVVTDVSGAVIPAAKVSAVSKDTGQSTTTDSNGTGSFELPLLRPGIYQVKVSASGFKSAVVNEVLVQVESRIRLDLKLEVGDAATSISVEASAPLVESETASLGTVVASRSVQGLPIRGRNVFDLVALSPGVQVNPNSQGGVASTGSVATPLFVQSDISINGGRFRTNEFLLDGVSIMLPENNDFAISPTPEGTQEFKVLSNSYGPQFGRSGGGVINVITRGGTDEFHGALYEFFRNDRLTANNYFANAQGRPRGPFHYNQFGVAVGGPIIKNKTFFFAEYQGHRQLSTLAGQFATLPTALQRAGDFSQTFNSAGQLVLISDPTTTRVNPAGGSIRDPFPGNKIPANRIDPVSAKLLSYVPLPNLPGSTPALINNYVWAQQNPINSDQWSARIDHRFSDRNSIFGRITRNTGNAASSGPFNTPADNVLGIDQNRVWNGVINGVYAFSPTRLVNWRYGLSRRFEGRVPLHAGQVTLSELGFPKAVEAAAQEQDYPTVTIAGISQLGPAGGNRIRRGNDIHTWVADLTEIRGRHTMVAGIDTRLYNQNAYQAGSSSGGYSFSNSFTQGPNPLTTSLTSGNAFASFLTGYGTGSIQSVPALAIRNSYMGLYFNDEIKLGRMTLNAGLRYDYESPRTERYNRFSTFDFTTPFPIQVPGLPNLMGALTHPGQGGQPRGNFNSAYGNLGPRIGLAYRLTNRTAIRSGYGIYYAPVQGTTSASGFGSSGADISTNWVSSLDGITPLNPLSNPYPTGVLPPLTTKSDLLLLGQSINIRDRGNRANTYAQQWNFGIQQEFASDWLIEVAYAGNKGTRLPVNWNWDQLDPKYQSLGNDLNKLVPNPFYGLVTTGTLAAATVAQSQLLRPYPQYTGITSSSSFAIAQNMGSSVYHSAVVRVEKRFSKGLTVLLSYTASKLIDNASGRIFGINGNSTPVQNYYDLRSERSVSEGDVPRRLVFSHTYDLPFGKGRKFLAGGPSALNWIVGGWSANGIASYSSGFPLELSSNGNSGVGGGILRPNSTGQTAFLTGTVESRLNQYFNTSVFTLPPTYTFGNVARTLPDVRAPSRINYDFALSKAIPVGDRFNVLFRTEAFNLTNTPYFGIPGTNLGSANFGVISSSTGERQVQFSLKVLF